MQEAIARESPYAELQEETAHAHPKPRNLNPKSLSLKPMFGSSETAISSACSCAQDRALAFEGQDAIQEHGWLTQDATSGTGAYDLRL